MWHILIFSSLTFSPLAAPVLLGMKTTSDPYVEVRLCPNGIFGSEKEKILIGTTNTKFKTLAPRWDQTFSVSRPKSHFNDFAVFELTIMDYDDDSDDDLMGVVPVNIPISRPGTTTKWYGVPAASANGEEATGRIQCMLNNSFSAKTHQELKGDKNTSTKSKSFPELMFPSMQGQQWAELTLTVKKAEGLSAMDRNFLGKL